VINNNRSESVNTATDVFRWCEWKINRTAPRSDPKKNPHRNRIWKYQAFSILHAISYIWNHRSVRCIDRSMDCYTIAQRNCDLGNDNKRPSHCRVVVELWISLTHYASLTNHNTPRARTGKQRWWSMTKWHW